MQKITFNINNYVLVKLTPFGKDRLREDHYTFWNYTNKAVVPEFNLPEEDANGYSKWQLWNLMERLGKYCSIGSKIPFETEIIFIRNIDND